MGRKRTPGLYKRKGTWHIDKGINGRRVCQSTGTDQLEEAERFLARLVEGSRQATIYGVRPKWTFEQAAARFVHENQHKRSLNADVYRLQNLLPWIGTLPLESVHSGTLQPWLEHRRSEGVKAATINHGLKIVRRILNLAATEWIDEQGLTWIAFAPKIRLLVVRDQRQPYPLSWEEQDRLFHELPRYLADIALFAVNTECRDREICGLHWEWEVKIPELTTSMFIIPGNVVKNGDERLIVLNRDARSVVEGCRKQHPTHVFSCKGRPMVRMLSNGWRAARGRAELQQVRVHDLKHTFGRRLRSAGVSFEDRQDLLGHRSGRMTTHYSAAELSNLIEAANRVCERDDGRPQLVVLRRLSVA